jgi:hypothetical protein
MTHPWREVFIFKKAQQDGVKSTNYRLVGEVSEKLKELAPREMTTRTNLSVVQIKSFSLFSTKHAC